MNEILLLYTNSQDFRLVQMHDIGLFQYNHEQRLWEVVVTEHRSPMRLKRSANRDMLLELAPYFVQVNQKFIINLNYLKEVIENVCHFYSPFEWIDYVKVGRMYRKKFVSRFNSL